MQLIDKFQESKKYSIVMVTDMRIVALYKEYNTVIKPLIAELEARTEQFEN